VTVQLTSTPPGVVKLDASCMGLSNRQARCPAGTKKAAAGFRAVAFRMC